jgi:hypothetical protein
LLANVDAVRVRNFGISLRDTAPRGGTAVGGSRYLRKRIARLNGDVQIGFQARDFGRHHDFCAGRQAGRVNDPGIGRAQFLPARTAAKILLRELGGAIGAGARLGSAGSGANLRDSNFGPATFVEKFGRISGAGATRGTPTRGTDG